MNSFTQRSVVENRLPFFQQSEDLADPLISGFEIDVIRENLLVETISAAFGASRGGRLRRPSLEAMEWIVSDQSEQPFSFYHCCLAAGVDPETLREWIDYYRKVFDV